MLPTNLSSLVKFKLVLSYAGFDVVSLANNHMNDYGDKHVNFTVKSLNDAGIKTFGINYGPTFSSQVSRYQFKAYRLDYPLKWFKRQSSTIESC